MLGGPDEQEPQQTVRQKDVLKVAGGVTGFYTYLMNGVEVVRCPFDKSHMMRSKRIQPHLMKCLKQHRGEKVVCPYNATEYVTVENFMSHIAVCPSRNAVIVNRWKSDVNTVDHKVTSPPVDRSVPYEIDEYW